MDQVAFDTQEFVETLENAGLSKDQARAISIAVRKSYEVADVATRCDLEDAKKDIGARFDKVDAQIADVRKELSAEIAEARKDTAARFEKVEAQIQYQSEKTNAKIADARKEAAVRADRTDAEITGVRKDMAARFEKNEAHMLARFEKSDAQVALLRKDVESLTNKMIIKMASIMVGVIGVATGIIKLF